MTLFVKQKVHENLRSGLSYLEVKCEVVHLRTSKLSAHVEKIKLSAFMKGLKTVSETGVEIFRSMKY